MKYYECLTDFIFVEHKPQKADYIFIPGSGYGELALHAAQLYRQGFSEKIVVSGKYSILQNGFAGAVSPEEYRGKTYETECDFLTSVLLEHGVPMDAVIQEKQATYTYENAIYTRKLLGEETVKRAILVCKTYHARRCLMYYSILFPETEILICPVVADGITKENWHTEPDKIDRVLGEVERCGKQFHEIMKERLENDKSMCI